MVFRVPSLSQSRQKQDELNQSVPSPAQSLLSRRKNGETTEGSGTAKRKQPSTPSVWKHANSNSDASIKATAVDRRGSGKAIGTTVKKRAVVVNPYAKKKPRNSNTTVANTTNNNRTFSNSADVAANANVNRQSYSHSVTTNKSTTPNTPQGEPTGLPKLPSSGPRKVVDIRNTSFSQAFDTVEETCHYDTELSILRESSTSTSTSGRKGGASNNHPITAATTTPTPTARESPDTDDRSHRALLQPHVLHVSTRQRANPILKLLRNVPYTFSKITPDYVLSPNRCALFLSIRYHTLHPDYVHARIAELRSDYDLRVLLCLVDVEDNNATLLFLNKLCVVNDVTLLLAWSEAEVARYLETLKAFEGKDASSIMKRKKTTMEEQTADVLGCVRSVNKTDAMRLMEQFGTLGGVMKAGVEELGGCVGIGDKKVRRLWEAFRKPFSGRKVERDRKEREEAELVARKADKKEVGDDGDGDGDGGEDNCDEVVLAKDSAGDDGAGDDNYEVEILGTRDVGSDALDEVYINNDTSTTMLDIGSIAQV